MGAVSTRHAGKRSRPRHPAQARRGEGGERREGDQLLPQPRADRVRHAAGARVRDPLAARRGREEAEGGRGTTPSARCAPTSSARASSSAATSRPTERAASPSSSRARTISSRSSGCRGRCSPRSSSRTRRSSSRSSTSSRARGASCSATGAPGASSAARATGSRRSSRITSEDVLSQADAGGLSQPRYERGQDEEVHRHLKRVADVLHRRFRRAGFDHLLIGSPEELTSDVERTLHPDIAQRLAGRVTVDVENTTDDDVLDGRAAAHRGARADRRARRARPAEAGRGRRRPRRRRARRRAGRAERAPRRDAPDRGAVPDAGHGLPAVRLAPPRERDVVPGRRHGRPSATTTSSRRPSSWPSRSPRT